MTAPRLPDPAVVVLAGAAGSGKSTWAAARFRATEIVSSDSLRAVVGSGPADLDATTEAFDLLDQIVSARTRRGLTTVIDTLGLDADRRRDYLRLARAAGLPGSLRECGVSEGILPLLAHEANQQWTARFNPRPVAEADILTIYQAAW